MREMSVPEHWQAVRLGDYIFKPEYGYTASATHDAIGSKFLRITDIQDDGVDWKSVPYCECDEDTKKKYLLVPGDIVITRIGATTGKAFLVNDCPESMFASYLIRVKTKPALLSPFLSAYFRTEDYWRQIHQSKGGRLKGGVNIPILQNLKIPLPPLPEQRAIAHILGAIQEAKAARQRELTLERERKAALMDRLFSHGTKDEPRKQTEIGEIPESWEVVKLGQLCRVFSGYGFKTKDYTKEGIPLIKIGNLQDGKVVINPENDYMPKSWQENEKLQKFILKSRDILIALTGATTGKTAIVPPSLAGTFLNQRVGKIELISPHTEQDFILVAVKTRFFQEAIQQNILRSAQGNISPSAVAQIPIPRPLLSEQRTIANVFRAIDKKAAALEQEAARLDELFHAMLDELMTGKRSAIPLIDVESAQSA